MGLRCHVCDGPVVNGRCKYCGMPYRNDEVLYHLNESRTDHYRHATPNARKIMKNQEIPVGDKKESTGRTSSKEEIKAHQQRVRQDAMKRMTETKGRPSGSAAGLEKKHAGTVPNVRKQTETGNKKNRSRINLFIWTVVALIVLVSAASGYIVERVENSGFVENYMETEEYETAPIEENTEPAKISGMITGERTEFAEWTDGDGKEGYYLGSDFGEVVAGTDLEPGTYEASIEGGSAVVWKQDGYSSRDYEIRDEHRTIVLVVGDGDTLWVQSDSQADRVLLSRLNSH